MRAPMGGRAEVDLSSDCSRGVRERGGACR